MCIKIFFTKSNIKTTSPQSFAIDNSTDLMRHTTQHRNKLKLASPLILFKFVLDLIEM